MCVVCFLQRVCQSNYCFRVLFHSFTFSVKHLGDVQELLGHLEGSVQVTNGVVLRGDIITVGLHWVCRETTKRRRQESQ